MHHLFFIWCLTDFVHLDCYVFWIGGVSAFFYGVMNLNIELPCVVTAFLTMERAGYDSSCVRHLKVMCAYGGMFTHLHRFELVRVIGKVFASSVSEH
jgi:hypothetical protein